VTIFSGLASKLVVPVFSGLASKPVVTVYPGLASKQMALGFLFGPQNWQLQFGILGLKITATISSVGDEDITPLDTNNNPPLNVQGPITRARARQLNLEVSSFLNSSSYDYENRLQPNDYIVIRDHAEGQGILGEGLGGMEDQQGRTSQEGGPNQLTSGLFLGSRRSLH
jgi:hypothetical protein